MSSMFVTHQFNAQISLLLKQLRLSGILATLEARHQQASDTQWSCVEFLEHLLEDEVERREQKLLALRLHNAAVNTTKTLESYDWSFNPALNRQREHLLASRDYLRRKRNILICGPAGTHKSHLAQARCHEADRQGFDVLFISTHKMLTDLHDGRAAGRTFDRRLATYLRPDLLVLDDFGLKILSALAPSDLYDVINVRYQVGSILVTSNRAWSERPELCGDPLLVSAGLDRSARDAETLLLTGLSYRTQRTAESKGDEKTPH